MNVVVLQGAGEIGKLNHLSQMKSKFAPESVTQIDLKQSGIGGLETALVSPSLFSQEARLVVVTNILDSIDLGKLRQEDAVTLVIVSSAIKAGTALATSLKTLQAKTLTFEGEKEVSAFPFLDNLIEGKKTAFIELEKLLQEYGGMYILSMIYYLLRRNLLPLPASDFMQKKIKLQKQKYQPEDFKKAYARVLDTEWSIKNGEISEKLGLTKLVQSFMG